MLNNLGAALSMANKFDQSISVLELFPNSSTIPDDIRLQSLSYGMLVVKPYLILYVVQNDIPRIASADRERQLDA